MSGRLQVRGIHKAFGGVVALRGVDLDVNAGEILGIIGPNGAGKTTLFNVITGVERPDAGEVVFNGRAITGLSPHRIAHLGLTRTFQMTRVFKRLTVFANMVVAVGAGVYRRPWLTVGSRPRPSQLARARVLLEAAGLETYADVPAGTLPLGLQRRLELHRALALEPTVLLLDEPVAGLSAQEASEFAALIRHLQQESWTFAVVEHNMAVAMAISDRMVVLHHGAVIAEGSPEDVRRDRAVVEAYLGPE